MKKIYFIMIALIATLVVSAQTIEVYEYDSSGNLNNTPAYTSSKKVKVIFRDNTEQGSESIDSYEYVDLGLPSGTLWATCNIGANSPEEYGDYFAWGEIEPMNETRSGYKWYNEDKQYTKYCTDSEYGIVDNKTELAPEDDAATANWGNNWCMPTSKQLDELFNSTTKEWTTLNGVYGCKITSKTNGNSIFLPAARDYDEQYDRFFGTYGAYWSRSLN